jgi:hypothetical protein
VEQLTAHHDALRFEYHRDAKSGWQQEYGPGKGGLVTEDLQAASAASAGALITEYGNKHQRGLDIEKGELIRVVLMQTPGTESHNRLLMVIHHLAVDGVSWRILLEDLEGLLTAIMQGEQPLPGNRAVLTGGGTKPSIGMGEQAAII